ncbi:MAG TPA: biotin-dependent carboxyltransferase family protein [Candidatus Limnocylindrales bacterium]|nr:biotin-dependent carboxyltransferase family protein [Candidatus Limnocylindrales bacterium]
MSLEVLDPGMLTTVQDAGRPEWTHLGVPIGGACDTWSLAVANRLAGNGPEAAALELTIVGPTLAIREAIVVGLAGADLGGIARPGDRRLEPGRSHRLEPGITISFPGWAAASDGAIGGAVGARGYLAVPGGVDVPEVLGSRSTSLAGAFGGLDGRPLRAGDTIRGLRAGSLAPAERHWPALSDDPLAGDPERPIRVVRGPGAGDDAKAFEHIVASPWRVAAGSDRVGLRLEGPPLDVPHHGRMASHGVAFGAVQVPPDGTPIVLLADHQTTGGYPVAAVAISADRPRLGQLRPGSSVSFVEVTAADAVAALARQRAALDRGAALLRDADGWDELWRSAGG